MDQKRGSENRIKIAKMIREARAVGLTNKEIIKSIQASKKAWIKAFGGLDVVIVDGKPTRIQ